MPFKIRDFSPLQSYTRKARRFEGNYIVRNPRVSGKDAQVWGSSAEIVICG